MADMLRTGHTFIFDRKIAPLYDGLNDSEENRKHVLVVDDDMKFCEAAGMALNLAGFKTSFAFTGSVALATIIDAHKKGRYFDLIMLDICAPVSHMSGTELLNEMKSIGISWPVLTTESCRPSREYKGALERIGKSFSARELIRRVKSMLLIYGQSY